MTAAPLKMPIKQLIWLVVKMCAERTWCAVGNEIGPVGGINIDRAGDDHEKNNTDRGDILEQNQQTKTKVKPSYQYCVHDCGHFGSNGAEDRKDN